MKTELETGEAAGIGKTLYTLSFKLSCRNEKFRDEVSDMIIAALGGAVVGEPEEKKPALGFQLPEEE